MTYSPPPSPRRTRLVATLGPATDADADLRALLTAGLDVARINAAHGGPETIRARAAQVRRCAAELGVEVSLLLDLQGPKIRVGDLPQPLTLTAGETVALHAHEGAAAEPVGAGGPTIPVTYAPLARDVRPGERVLLADGLLRLEVLDTDQRGTVTCRVVVGGTLTAHKGVNLPDSALSAKAPTAEDLDIARVGIEAGVDFLGLSFTRGPEDVLRLREAVNGVAAIVAKIERPDALARIEEIVRVADAVMVARGDLGVELPLEVVPQAELAILRAAHRHGTPAIVATEMLESMQQQARPTRAEATDVFYAVANRTDAVMLSAETAVGRYPVTTVEMLGRLSQAAEAVLTYEQEPPDEPDVPAHVGYSAVRLATALGAKAIVTPTSSGRTARQVARFRPAVPILAIVPEVAVARRLGLTWGVTPIVAPMPPETDHLIEAAVAAARDRGHLAAGDRVIITAGVPVGGAGTTNLVKVHRIGEKPL